jgi:LuxR family transcriptional regulator, maltose regulon positive regulatory protein
LPPLTITNLGSFQVRCGDQILPICRASKAIVLMRYLLTRLQRSASRDELMDVIWPNAQPREAAHNLHVAVSTLRRYLDPAGGSYIVFASGNYAFNPADTVDDDGTRFVRLSAEAEGFWRSGASDQAEQAYSAAITCYHGDYHVGDHDATWAVGERERLLTRYLLALERLGHLWMRRQQFDAAAECFQLLLDRDNYREDVYGQIIQCYARLGRRSHALLQYQRCVSVLAGDLGREPMPETQALYHLIMSSDTAAR